MVVLVMFRMMSVVMVASAAIPSLCLLHRGPGRHVAADRGWRLLEKRDNKKSEEFRKILFYNWIKRCFLGLFI